MDPRLAADLPLMLPCRWRLYKPELKLDCVSESVIRAYLRAYCTARATPTLVRGDLFDPIRGGVPQAANRVPASSHRRRCLQTTGDEAR